MSFLAAPKVKAGFEATTGVWLSEEDIDMADCCLLKVKGFGVSDGTVGIQKEVAKNLFFFFQQIFFLLFLK